MLITLPIGQYHTQCYCRFSEEFSRTRVKNALTNAWSLSTWAETNWAHNGCMLWGNRVGIPSQGQKQLLEGLLNAHPGMVRWKIWRGATYGGQGWIQKLKIRSSHAKYVTRRDVDHLLKRHDVPGRANQDDDGDLPDFVRKTWYHPRPEWNKRVRSLKKLPLRQGFHRWISDQISDLQVLEGLRNFLNVAYPWGNDYFVYLGTLRHYGTILWHRVI